MLRDKEETNLRASNWCRLESPIRVLDRGHFQGCVHPHPQPPPSTVKITSHSGSIIGLIYDSSNSITKLDESEITVEKKFFGS